MGKNPNGKNGEKMGKKSILINGDYKIDPYKWGL